MEVNERAENSNLDLPTSILFPPPPPNEPAQETVNTISTEINTDNPTKNQNPKESVYKESQFKPPEELSGEVQNKKAKTLESNDLIRNSEGKEAIENKIERKETEDTLIDLELPRVFKEKAIVRGMAAGWTKSGADLSDYFNYGFNEDVFRIYSRKMRNMHQILRGLVKKNRDHKPNILKQGEVQHFEGGKTVLKKEKEDPQQKFDKQSENQNEQSQIQNIDQGIKTNQIRSDLKNQIQSTKNKIFNQETQKESKINSETSQVENAQISDLNNHLIEKIVEERPDQTTNNENQISSEIKIPSPPNKKTPSTLPGNHKTQTNTPNRPQTPMTPTINPSSDFLDSIPIPKPPPPPVESLNKKEPKISLLKKEKHLLIPGGGMDHEKLEIICYPNSENNPKSISNKRKPAEIGGMGPLMFEELLKQNELVEMLNEQDEKFWLKYLFYDLKGIREFIVLEGMESDMVSFKEKSGRVLKHILEEKADVLLRGYRRLIGKGEGDLQALAELGGLKEGDLRGSKLRARGGGYIRVRERRRPMHFDEANLRGQNNDFYSGPTDYKSSRRMKREKYSNYGKGREHQHKSSRDQRDHFGRRGRYNAPERKYLELFQRSRSGSFSGRRLSSKSRDRRRKTSSEIREDRRRKKKREFKEKKREEKRMREREIQKSLERDMIFQNMVRMSEERKNKKKERKKKKKKKKKENKNGSGRDTSQISQRTKEKAEFSKPNSQSKELEESKTSLKNRNDLTLPDKLKTKDPSIENRKSKEIKKDKKEKKKKKSKKDKKRKKRKQNRNISPNENQRNKFSKPNYSQNKNERSQKEKLYSDYFKNNRPNENQNETDSEDRNPKVFRNQSQNSHSDQKEKKKKPSKSSSKQTKKSKSDRKKLSNKKLDSRKESLSNVKSSKSRNKNQKKQEQEEMETREEKRNREDQERVKRDTESESLRRRIKTSKRKTRQINNILRSVSGFNPNDNKKEKNIKDRIIVRKKETENTQENEERNNSVSSNTKKFKEQVKSRHTSRSLSKAAESEIKKTKKLIIDRKTLNLDLDKGNIESNRLIIKRNHNKFTSNSPDNQKSLKSDINLKKVKLDEIKPENSQKKENRNAIQEEGEIIPENSRSPKMSKFMRNQQRHRASSRLNSQSVSQTRNHRKNSKFRGRNKRDYNFSRENSEYDYSPDRRNRKYRHGRNRSPYRGRREFHGNNRFERRRGRERFGRDNRNYGSRYNRARRFDN